MASGRINTFPHWIKRWDLWFVSGLMLGCLAVVAAFFAATEGDLNFFFSSDSLYLPSIYQDIFQHGGHFSDWSLNPAPNFFPDVVLFFGLERVLGGFLAASYVFPMVHFIGIAFFFRMALRVGLGLRDDRPATFGALMVAAVFLCSAYGWGFGFAFHLLMNCFHQGAFLNAMIALVLLLWGIRREGWASVALLFLLAMVASASDRSFWPLFSIPACSILLFTAFRSGQRGRVVLLALTIAAGSALGYFLLRNSGLIIENPYQFMAFSRIEMSWHNFIDHFSRMFSGKDLVAFLTWSALAALMYSIWKAWLVFRDRLRLKGRSVDAAQDARVILLLFIPLACVLNLIAPVLSGTYDGDDSLRYNFAGIVLALLSSSLFIIDLGPRTRTFVTALPLAAVLIASIWVIAPSHGRMEALLHYQPERSRLMDEIAKEEGLRYGAADYWDAKLMTMFSREGLVISPVHKDQSLYVHVLRPAAHYAPEQDHARTFVVLARPGKDGIEEVTGLQQRMVERGDVKVVITEPWVFDPSTLQAVPVNR